MNLTESLLYLMIATIVLVLLIVVAGRAFNREVILLSLIHI